MDTFVYKPIREIITTDGIMFIFDELFDDK